MQPEDNIAAALTEAVSSSLRRVKENKPDQTVNSFIRRMADAIGKHEDTVGGWYYGDRLIDHTNYWRLVIHLGVDFADAVTNAMTGWRVIENDKALFERMENAAKHTKLATDYLEGNVRELPVKGRVG